jgi:predicted phage terminase large subunit-like protein
MGALQYCDVPGYHALLLRPSLTEFELPGGLIELAHEWLARYKAQWSGDTRSWRFPGPGKTGAGGASLRFGYLDSIKDVARYAGSSFSYVGFDELVRFDQRVYQLMFRLLRQARDADNRTLPAADGTRLADVPARARATSNPGGPGHAWVKSYFVDPATRKDDVLFVPSRLADNPFIDRDGYLASLDVLPHAERERLLNGDWNIPDDGELFQRDWFEQIDRHQLPPLNRSVRFWDLAATEPTASSPDPDYTVGLRLDLDERTGDSYVTDVVRVRKAPGAIEQLVASTAHLDGKSVRISIEQEPGAAGLAVIDRYKRHVLRGFSVRGERATGAKEVRASVAAAAAENGLIKIIRGRNTNELIDELCAFPHGAHDDCVDALAGAHQALSHTPIRLTIHAPRGTIYDPPEHSRTQQPRATPTRFALLSRHRLDEETAQIAAQIGVSFQSTTTPS